MAVCLFWTKFFIISVTEVTHEAADLFWSQGLKLQHHDNHFFEGFMMDKTLYKTLFICRLIFFLLKRMPGEKISAVVCTSLHCLPAAGNTFEQNIFKEMLNESVFVHQTD